jgi:hypothetical protein
MHYQDMGPVSRPSRASLPAANTEGKTQAKISSFKNHHIKLELLLPRDQNPLSYSIL